MPDHFDLQRFVAAQASVHDVVMAELAAGRKRTHWMWFVFPQIAGLGSSTMAQCYAIGSLDEARAYLVHSVLGARLRQATRMVIEVEGRSAHDIFGAPDDMKFHSSMTLFAQAAPDEAVFAQALSRYFEAERDEATLACCMKVADRACPARQNSSAVIPGERSEDPGSVLLARSEKRAGSGFGCADPE